MKLPNMTLKQKIIVTGKIMCWILFLVAIILRQWLAAIILGVIVGWDIFNILRDWRRYNEENKKP